MRGRLVTAVVVAVGVSQTGAGHAQMPPIGAVPVAERLWTVQISAGDMIAVPKELERLAELCRTSAAQGLATATASSETEKLLACKVRNLRSRQPIGALRASPDPTSPVVAIIHQEMQFAADGELNVLWSVELVTAPGVMLPWPDASAAFDYGLHVAGVQRRGEWIRLLASIPADGWLPITPIDNPPASAAMYVFVERLAGQVVELSPLPALWPDGRRQQLDAGSYFIQNVTDDSIELRQEIPSDFPCGRPVEVPAVMPPTLRALATEFFDGAGGPRFATKYTKGC